VKQQEVILAEGARKQETGSDVTNEGVFEYIYIIVLSIILFSILQSLRNGTQGTKKEPA